MPSDQSDTTEPTADEVVMQALNDCRGGDGAPEWWRDDAATVLNALRDAGFILVKDAPHG